MSVHASASTVRRVKFSVEGSSLQPRYFPLGRGPRGCQCVGQAFPPFLKPAFRVILEIEVPEKVCAMAAPVVFAGALLAAAVSAAVPADEVISTLTIESPSKYDGERWRPSLTPVT